MEVIGDWRVGEVKNEHRARRSRSYTEPVIRNRAVARCVSEGMLGFAFWLLTSQCALARSTFNRRLLIDSSKHSLAHAAGY